jgi:hypothetical protein
MAQFIEYNPNCKYCKGTGIVQLATSSKPCLDCKKEIFYTDKTTDDIDNLIIMDQDFGQSI